MADEYLNSPGFNLAFPTQENAPSWAPEEGPTNEAAIQQEIDKVELELAELEYKKLLKQAGQRPTITGRSPNLDFHLKEVQKEDEQNRWAALARTFTTDLGSVADEVVKAGKESWSASSAALGGMTGVGQSSYPQDTTEITPLEYQQGPLSGMVQGQQAMLMGGETPEKVAAETESVYIPTIDDPMVNTALIFTDIGSSVKALRAAGLSGNAFKVELAKEIGDWVTGLRSLKNLATAPVKAAVRGVAAPKMEAIRTASLAEDIYKIPQVGEATTDVIKAAKGVKTAEELATQKANIEDIKADEQALITGLEKQHQIGLESDKVEKRSFAWMLRQEPPYRKGEANYAVYNKLQQQAASMGVSTDEIAKYPTVEGLQKFVDKKAKEVRTQLIERFKAYQEQYEPAAAEAVSPATTPKRGRKAKTYEWVLEDWEKTNPRILADKYGLEYKGKEQGVPTDAQLQSLYADQWQEIKKGLEEVNPEWFVFKSDPTVNIYLKPSELNEANIIKAIEENKRKFPGLTNEVRRLTSTDLKIMKREKVGNVYQIGEVPEETVKDIKALATKAIQLKKQGKLSDLSKEELLALSRADLATYPELGEYQTDIANAATRAATKSEPPKKVYTSAEEFLADGLGTKATGTAGLPTDEPIVGAASQKKLLDDWAKQVDAELSLMDDPEKGAVDIDPTAFYHGLRENWVKIKQGVSSAAKDARLFLASPQYASSDPFYKKAFEFHHKNYWMKQRVADTILMDFAKVDKGLSDASQVRIFDALEKPILANHLTDSERKAYLWTKKFYDNYFDLFVEIKAGDQAPLIKTLAESLKGQKVDLRQVKRDFKLSNNAVRALEVARRKKDNYAPHIFNKMELMDSLEKKYLDLLHKNADYDNEEVRQVRNLILELKKEGTVSVDFVPTKLRNQFFEKREGLEGYKRNNKEAMTKWLKGWLREVYDEPAMKLWAKNMKKMEPGAADSARSLLRDYLGMNDRSPLWSALKSAEYMRIFGLNLSSAAVNSLQKINTIADAGLINSAKGYAYGMSKEGKRLWAQSGLAQDSYDYMSSGEPLNESLTKLRSALGVFHRVAENGNRKHAYLTYLLQGSKKFDNFEDAHWFAASKMFQTQFEYGPLGMPKAMRGRTGLLTQFWSFPIKTVENIATMAKTNPKGLLAWAALTEGGREAVSHYLDLDLSNQLGFGMDWGEAYKTIREAADGDLQAAQAHLKLVPKQGTGILPGIAPTIDLVDSFFRKGLWNQEWKDFKDNLTPVAWKKMMQFKAALDHGTANRYPIYDVNIKGERTSSPKYFLNMEQLLSKTFFFKPKAITDDQKLLQTRRVTDEMYNETASEYARALVQHDYTTLNNLMSNQHPVYPSRESVENAFIAERYSPAERQQMMDRRKKLRMFNQQLMGE